MNPSSLVLQILKSLHITSSRFNQRTFDPREWWTQTAGSTAPIRQRRSAKLGESRLGAEGETSHTQACQAQVRLSITVSPLDACQVSFLQEFSVCKGLALTATHRHRPVKIPMSGRERRLSRSLLTKVLTSPCLCSYPYHTKIA